MKFDKIIVQPCLNPPPPSAPCPDTPTQPTTDPLLILKPAVLCLSIDGTAQLRAFAFQDGIEMEIHGGLTFTSSDQSIATVGAVSGSVTGVKGGIVSIAVDWNGQLANSQVTVLASDSPDVNVGMVLLIDDSLSTSQPFGGAYATRLSFAKAAARQFAGDLNTTKDQMALVRFDEAGTDVEGLTNDVVLLQSGIDSLFSTALSTNLYDALTDAMAVLDGSGLDKSVIVLVSDGQNKLGPDPLPLASSFKDSGGIILVLGVRASDEGFDLLTQLASAGLFVNATSENVSDAILWFRSMKGYFCAGNCNPPGDVYVGKGALNYDSFEKWSVIGNVDLIGGSPPYALFDLLPGNGLYVDMCGSSSPWFGTIETIDPIPLTAGKTYEVSFYLAGNQRGNGALEIVRVRLGTVLNEHVNINDWQQGFTRYSFTVTPLADEDANLSFAQIFTSSADPYGTLLDNITVRNTTDGIDVFSDNFDAENSSYITPACGPGLVVATGKDLINLHVVEDGPGLKTGAAAIGNPGDFWNGYQPRITNGPFLPSLALKSADGTSSDVSISQFPDPGERWWETILTTPSVDPLMVLAATTKDAPDEIDPWQDCGHFETFNAIESGCRWLKISGLAEGSYDFYVYGHGGAPSLNSRFRLTVEFGAGEEKQTNEGSGYLADDYVEGEQYVLFKDVQIAAGQNAYLFLLPPVDNSGDVGFNSWNGMQILRKNPPAQGYGYECEGFGCLHDPVPEQEEDLIALPDSEQPGRTEYLSNKCFTAVCETSTVGDPVTKCASASSHISQARADKKASNRARRFAEAALDCTGSPEAVGPVADVVAATGLNYLFSTLGFALINNDSGNWHLIHIVGEMNDEQLEQEDAVALVPAGAVIGAGLNYEFSTSARFRIKNLTNGKYHGIWTVGAVDEEQLEIGAGGSSSPDVTLLSGPRFRFYLNQFWVKNVDTNLWQAPSFSGPDNASQLIYGAQSV